MIKNILNLGDAAAYTVILVTEINYEINLDSNQIILMN